MISLKITVTLHVSSLASPLSAPPQVVDMAGYIVINHTIMNTQLHHSPIYGPVHSRRLGLSVGINLMPGDGKYCTFDCIYCECGYNSERRTHSPRPTRHEVAQALEAQLQQLEAQGEHPDVLTFAGNGEPTAHPDFGAIVDDVAALRDRYCPQARLSVLSNSTQIHRPKIRQALMKVDCNILKLDTADDAYIARVNRPTSPAYRVADIIRDMADFRGHVIIQTLFMHGTMDGADVTNTTPYYIEPWLAALRRIAPQEVMIYTIDRPTPDTTLQKATPAELDAIRQQVEALGIACTASY